MRKSVAFAMVLGLELSFATATSGMAHSGSGTPTIGVEPANVTAGGTVILAGSGLEPDADRVLVLAGEGLTVEFGTVRTDAEGMFTRTLTIPSHLPTGAYELRAIGDETLTTPLAVTAGAGAAQGSSPSNPATETVVARDRSPIDLSLILAFAAVAAIAGVLLIWRAERFRGPAQG